jgi:hypothetical protein
MYAAHEAIGQRASGGEILGGETETLCDLANRPTRGDMAMRLSLRLPEQNARTSLHCRRPAVADGRLAPTRRERLARFHGDSAARLPTDPGLTHHTSPLVHYL